VGYDAQVAGGRTDRDRELFGRLRRQHRLHVFAAVEMTVGSLSSPSW
jgi:hypothetical protein